MNTQINNLQNPNNTLCTQRIDKFNNLIYEGNILKGKAKIKKQMRDYYILILYLESKKEFVLFDLTGDCYPLNLTITAHFTKIGTLNEALNHIQKSKEALEDFKKSFWSMSEIERLRHLRKLEKKGDKEVLNRYNEALEKIKAWGVDLWDSNQTLNAQELNQAQNSQELNI